MGRLPGWQRPVALLLSLALTAGCATAPPYTGQGPHPQIERGAAVPPIDFLGNVLSLPFKLVFWSWEFNLHSISPATEQELVEYLGARDLPAFKDTRYQLNEWNPGQDLSRLISNKHAAWPYRLLLGLPITIIGDVLLPGRLFPWGDYYNPFTNTVHLYSDHPAIALHEAGHAHDVASRRYKGTYAAVYLLPFVPLYHEYQATHEAIGYLKDTGKRAHEINAYKILYPAYGSYAGGCFGPIGWLVGILIGHAAGRSEAAVRTAHYQKLDLPQEPVEPQPSPQPQPVEARP